MSKNWDKENMKTVAANMKKEEVEAFRKLAEERGTTVGGMLRGYVRGCLAESNGSDKVSSAPAPWGVNHIVSYKNTDRLKREVAFYNPKGLNPDLMLNEILNSYFAFVESARKKSN